MDITKILLLLGAAGIIVLGIKLLERSGSGGKKEKEAEAPLPIEKKPYVFDVMSELSLYRKLLELFSDRYYIFPQMSYGRIIQVKNGVDKWRRGAFDKKIADFVLCDKERAVARLVIELDGASHRSKRKMERDEKVDAMMAKIGLPILHLKTGNLDGEHIRQEVAKKLNNR